MKTYITIITLSFIVCYLEITNIHIEAIVQKNIILQQETISKKISQKELNRNTQKKTIQSHDTRQKIIQKQKHSQPKQKKRSFHQNKKTV